MTPNQIGRTLGKMLIKRGMFILKKSVVLTPTITASYTARLFLQGYFPKAKIIMLDGKYRIIPWEQWLLVDEQIYDITKQPYVKEFSDCDDRAYITKYFTQKIFGIPQIIVHGHCYDKEGKWLFGHFFCARISDGKLYAYEPIGNHWTEVKKGEKIWMKNREYRCLTIEF